MFRGVLSSIAGSSTARQMRSTGRARIAFPRPFTSSTPAYKKRKTVEYDEDIDPSLEAESEDSLFDVTTNIPSGGLAEDRLTQRQRYRDSIIAVAAAKGVERKEAATTMRVGVLRKVIQLSDSQEELEELRGVLRGWRVLGGKVTGQTAKEIIGRCCNLGRPDLAKEFSVDRMQYGLPVIHDTLQQKLQAALSTYSPPSPSAAQDTA